MIDFERAEKAAEFIRDNAKDYGDLVGHCKSLEHQRKVVLGAAFLDAKGNDPKRSVGECDARAQTSPEFKSIVEDIENAWAEKTTIETKIKAAELTIELWRSINSYDKRMDRSHR